MAHYPNDVPPRVCQQATSPNLTAEQWAAYFRIQVYVSDLDLVTYKWYSPEFPDCHCELNELQGEIGGGPVEITWSGSVDLTTVGTYTLVAHVHEKTPDLIPCPCWFYRSCPSDDPNHCGHRTYPSWYQDPDIDVACYGQVFQDGRWILHDESRVGTPSRITQTYTYWRGPFETLSVEDAFLNPTGVLWDLAVGNISLLGDNTDFAELEYGTAQTSKWRKVWRWERALGVPADCPALPREFRYEITLGGRAEIQGDATTYYQSGGISTADGTASATISLVGDDPHHEFTPQAEVTVDGTACEQPKSVQFSLNWWNGPTIGPTTTPGITTYDKSLPFTKTFTGSVKGGNGRKEVVCEIIWSAHGHVRIDNAPKQARCKMNLSLTSGTFE